jgi:hypothetical protein
LPRGVGVGIVREIFFPSIIFWMGVFSVR